MFYTGKQKITDEIAKLKYKDPNSTRLTTLEHELVRAEAQNLVAEAQLSNTVCDAPVCLNILAPCGTRLLDCVEFS